MVRELKREVCGEMGITWLTKGVRGYDLGVDILIYIKRLVMLGRLDFTLKATFEMDADNLTRDEVSEALVTASSWIREVVLKSNSPFW